jgi:ABC-type uncharacterized transport system involved in gliding motility auxiliary subunit
LEYDLSRAIARVTSGEKPVIGVMSPLPVFGQPMNPMMMQMGQRGQQPWVLANELKRDFEVKTVEMTAERIPDEIKVLLLIHPKEISEKAEFAIDQFVLRGGKLIAFVDPQGALDRSTPQMGMMMGPPPSSSTLPHLFKAWGISFEAGKTVADAEYAAPLRQGPNPAVLMLSAGAFSRDDVITADADNLFMAFAGAFTGTPAAGLQKSVLIKSSKNSQLIEAALAQMSGEQALRNFTPSGIEYPLAIRLTGKFKTAFPEGKPKAPEPAANEPTAEAKPAESKDPGALKEASQENTVVLIGDSDFIQDPIAVREIENPFGGQSLIMPANGNLALAQGAIEQLSGDSNLVAIRSRASRERPFEVVRKMQADAEANYRTKIRELEESLAEAQRKLSELQKNKDTGQRFILSPDQQQELATFRKKEAEVKTQLKEVRKRLRREIDSLENRLQWANIAGMPMLVAATGLGMALVKRKRAAAR